jgi:hypothetical protein
MSSNGSTGTSTPLPETAAKREKVTALLRGEEPASPRIAPRDDADDGADDLAPEPRRKDAPREQPPEPPGLEIDDDDEEQPKKKQQKTLRDFAAEHGFSVKALMSLIATESGESDEPLSFGQLRDHWKDTRQYQTERTEFDDWRSEAQNEITIARRQVQQIFERIAGIVPPQTLARVFSDAEFEHAETIKQAKAQLLEFYPEWRDPEKMGQARDAMAHHLSRWGFTRQDLATITSPMIIKYVQDNMRREARLERLLNGQREAPKASTAPPSKKGHRSTVDDRAKALAAAGDKHAAVELLLREGPRK